MLQQNVVSTLTVKEINLFGTDSTIPNSRRMCKTLGIKNEVLLTQDFHKKDLLILYNTIALSALKYFLLKIDSKKNKISEILFNSSTSFFYSHGFCLPV